METLINVEKEFDCPTSTASQQLGEQLGCLLLPGDVVGLIGPLGAGKTTFIQGVTRGIGVLSGYAVNSPTFTYANIYQGPYRVFHLDYYRLKSEADVYAKGMGELIGSDGISLIEWFDSFPKTWDQDRILVNIRVMPETRHMSIVGIGQRGASVVRQMVGAMT